MGESGKISHMQNNLKYLLVQGQIQTKKIENGIIQML